jgi:hypothetical protein
LSKIGLVIPWRETPSRLKPLDAVLKWYQTNLPDIEIFYSDRPGEYWNASASRNDGVKKAQEAHCDVIIVNDGDTIPEIEPLLEAIEQSKNDGLVHSPYNKCKYIDVEMSELYYAGKDIKLLKHTLYRPATGGIWVCTPETWWSLYGMDEKFQQWGPEDAAFDISHRIIKGVPLVAHEGYIYCLGHVHQLHNDGFVSSQHANSILWHLYLAATSPERIKWLVQEKDFSNLR